MLRRSHERKTLDDWLQEKGRFKIGEDILHPNESNNHQITQW